MSDIVKADDAGGMLSVIARAAADRGARAPERRGEGLRELGGTGAGQGRQAEEAHLLRRVPRDEGEGGSGVNHA